MNDARERRASRRYPIVYEVVSEKALGVTRDLITSGVTFITDGNTDFWIGEFLTFFIIIRRIGMTSNRLRCEGSVVRLATGKHDMDVAVCFEAFRFLIINEPQPVSEPAPSAVIPAGRA